MYIYTHMYRDVGGFGETLGKAGGPDPPVVIFLFPLQVNQAILSPKVRPGGERPGAKRRGGTKAKVQGED